MGYLDCYHTKEFDARKFKNMKIVNFRLANAANNFFELYLKKKILFPEIESLTVIGGEFIDEIGLIEKIFNNIDFKIKIQVDFVIPPKYKNK